MKYAVKYEDGPCASDCKEIEVYAEDADQAMEAVTSLVPKAMITCVTLVDSSAETCYNTHIATNSRKNRMAKETKAERLAREEAVRQSILEEQEASYPQRLMALMQRAQAVHFELAAGKDMIFVLYDRDVNRAPRYGVDFFYSTDAQSDLEDLEWAVKWKEDERADAERKYLVKQNALAKLSKEEKEALGL